MHKFLFPFFAVFLSGMLHAQTTYEYPRAPKDTVTDTYFGVRISDPYQWMENPEDPRLATWLEEENKLTKKENHKHKHLMALEDQISDLNQYRILQNLAVNITEENKNKRESKYVFKEDYVSVKRSPDLLYKKRGNGNYRLLVKTKRFRIGKEDNVMIAARFVKEDEDLAAVSISHSGSDWREVYFFDLKTGEQLPDTLKYLRGSSHFYWNGKNAFYDGYNKPEEGRVLLDKAAGQKLFYHRLGTPQSSDQMLYRNPDTTGTNIFTFFKSDDKFFFKHFYKYKGRWVKVLSVSDTDPKFFFLKNFIIYPSADSITMNIEEVYGDSVLLRTNWGAPNGRVLMARTSRLNQVTEFIPEYNVVLRQVNRLGKDKIACIYREKGRYLVMIYDLSGKLLKKINFPEGKKVKYFWENDPGARYTNFCVTSFYHPDVWYKLSLEDLNYQPVKSLSLRYDPKSLETRYIKYTSKDGTEIPMYITCLKKTKLDGKNPSILYGYGGYGITVEPEFDVAILHWLLHGGIYAVPNIRGGGAEGLEWEMAGKRLNKQNAIDDFIAAAEYLIDKKYTNPEKLAIIGRSHGGLLVGAALTQRPGLFKAAIAEAGAFDMLRFQKYTTGSVSTNINEYGDVSDSADFFNLLSYSPLHNIKEGVKYPNVLLITGDHDDRVPPFHTYKFLATLQEKGSPESLYLLYLLHGAGHGGAGTVDDSMDKLLFKYHYLYNQLDLQFY
ncbi:MAG: S9 family peptidase [Chlorobi bacterium]|nr:S9 family peptidase [Chlorobiota bacterium]